MDKEQENLKLDQQSYNDKELTVNNDADNLSTLTTLIVTDTMNSASTVEDELQCSNSTEEKNGASNEIKEKSDCLVANECANMILDISNKDIESNVSSISTQSLDEKSVLLMDTLDNQQQNNCEKNCEVLETCELQPIINNEVVIEKELITIDHPEKIDKECTELKNSKLGDNIANDEEMSLYFVDTKTSLEAIALQYDSSDSDEGKKTENNKQISNANDYRNKNEVIVSSDDSSDSESDSSSSESESDSDNSSLKSNKCHSEDSDDEKQAKNKKTNQNKNFKPKNEFDDLPPIEDLKISVPEVLCDPLGEVAWTVEQMVVVKPKPGKPTLNLDTVLFIEKGQRALGHIFDVFGQVAEPHYCVRFNSSDHIQESDIKIGMTVYYCPNTEYTSLVFLSELTKMKAVDDLEDDDPPQFSDDEEEQAYLANLKNRSNSNKTKDQSNERPNKRRRAGWQSNHPWNSSREQQTPHPAHPPPINQRPFYRSRHPWSRPRFQQPNPWNRYNSFPDEQWTRPYPPYPVQIQQMEMQNVGFPPVQWNPHYQLPQMNAAPLPGFPQTLVPPFTLPPPPPPPPPHPDT